MIGGRLGRGIRPSVLFATLPGYVCIGYLAAGLGYVLVGDVVT